MTLGKEEILEAVAALSVMELVELVDAMEEKFGVTATAVAAAPATGGEEAASETEEKTEVDVILTSHGDAKIPVLKAVREALGMGLKEAKDLIEDLPATLKEGMPRKDADELVSKLKESGATLETK